MIVVRVELWKGGNPDDVALLGVMRIVNDGSGSKTIGHYDVDIARLRGTGAWRSGRVENHRRLAVSVWRLVAKALAACLPPVKAAKDPRQEELL